MVLGTKEIKQTAVLLKKVKDTEGLGREPKNVFELRIHKRIPMMNPPAVVKVPLMSEYVTLMEVILKDLSSAQHVTTLKTLDAIREFYMTQSDCHTLVRARINVRFSPPAVSHDRNTCFPKKRSWYLA